MPIYEYVCDSCEHQFETIQKFSEDPLKTCPECAEDGLRKKVSIAAFRLKGGGWYETDFKSGDKRNVATDDKKSPDEGSKTKSSDTKSDKGTTDSSSKSSTTSSESKPTKSASSD